MLRISEDGLFFISMPENLEKNQKEMIHASIASISGKMPNKDALIRTMMSCFKGTYSSKEYAPEIVFFINYEGTTFVIDAQITMSFSDYLKAIGKFIK